MHICDNIICLLQVPMKTFSMTCSCGHVMSVQAKNRDEAVARMKAMMSPAAVEEHMRTLHPGEASIPVSRVHSMIEQGLAAAA